MFLSSHVLETCCLRALLLKARPQFRDEHGDSGKLRERAAEADVSKSNRSSILFVCCCGVLNVFARALNAKPLKAAGGLNSRNPFAKGTIASAEAVWKRSRKDLFPHSNAHQGLVPAHVRFLYTSARAHAHLLGHKFMFASMFICMCKYIGVCKYIYIYIYIVNLYIYMYMYT